MISWRPCSIARIVRRATHSGLAARDIVQLLLARLNPGDRLLLTLLHLDGCSVKEVMKITGWSSARIRVRAFRARRKLKDYFCKLMSEDEP